MRYSVIVKKGCTEVHGEDTEVHRVLGQHVVKKQKPTETTQERLKRITQFDIYQCPYCKTGKMQIIAILPRIRSPVNVLYKDKNALSVS